MVQIVVGQVRSPVTYTPPPKKAALPGWKKRLHPSANVLMAEKYKQETGVSGLVLQTVKPPEPKIPAVLVQAKERVDTGVSSLVQKTVPRPQPSTVPFLTNVQGVIIKENPAYIPPGKVKDVITGRPIVPLRLPGGVSYAEWDKMVKLQMRSDIEPRVSHLPWSEQMLWQKAYASTAGSERLRAEAVVRKKLESGTEFWGGINPRTRMYHTGTISLASAQLFPVSFAQIGMKYVTGKGAAWDLFGRVDTGHTLGVLPDIGKGTSEQMFAGQPSGLFSSAVEEGIGRYRGQETDAFARFWKDPASGIAGTIGEVAGMYSTGLALSGAKVGTVKGLGRLRAGLISRTGWNLPSYTKITYYLPHRYVRRWVVKKIGKTDIEAVVGKPLHTTETLTDRGLSFAPGKTTGERVTWTIKQTTETSKLPLSQGDYLLSSASGQSLGMQYTIKGVVSHELPSMSYTPFGLTPTRFYRFEGSSLNYSSKLSFIPRRWSPTGIVTRVKEVYYPPRGSFESIGKWGLKQPKGSWSVIGPKMLVGGPETELNIFGSKWSSYANRSTLYRYLPEPGKASLTQRLFGYQYYGKVPLEGGLTEVVPVKFTYLKGAGKPSGVRLVLGPQKSNRFFEGLKDVSLRSASSKGETSVSLFNIKTVASFASRKMKVSKIASLGSLSGATGLSLLGKGGSVSRGASQSSSLSSSSASSSSSISSVSRSLGRSIGSPSGSRGSTSSSIVSSTSRSVSRPRSRPFSYISSSIGSRASRSLSPSRSFVSRVYYPFSLSSTPLKSKSPTWDKKPAWRFSMKRKQRLKTLLADPFSVMESQQKYGRATHPLPTRSIWAEAGRAGWRLGTVELRKSKRSGRKRKRKRKYKKR